jgi:hypothetical protein
MIVTTAHAFRDAIANGDFSPRSASTARAAFLVAPTNFSLAAESATDNRYMDLSQTPDPTRAILQHAELARALSSDVPVITFPGDAEMPDGLFPNNVFATTPSQLIVGRMRHAVRQREAQRKDIRAWFDVLGYSLVDFSKADFVAELTGSLVIDRARGIGFCGLSERCDMAGARAMYEAFGLRLMYCFELAPNEYHTNVVLAVLASRAAIIAADGFRDVRDAQAIADFYAACCVQLSPGQKAAFAGNAITLNSERVWMSANAKRALNDDQINQLRTAGFCHRYS